MSRPADPVAAPVQVRRLGALLGVACMLAAGVAHGQDGARPGDDFLKLVDTRQYAESWAAASDYFRQSVGQRDWVAQVRQAREPLGDVTTRTVQSSEPQKDPPGAPTGDYLLTTYRTTFSASTTPRTETLPLVRGADGRWRAVGYFVR